MTAGIDVQSTGGGATGETESAAAMGTMAVASNGQ
jgi:hypothetical protein